MNQSKKKKRPQLYMPVSYTHSSQGEYMPIANVEPITPENALMREAMNGQEVSQ